MGGSHEEATVDQMVAQATCGGLCQAATNSRYSGRQADGKGYALGLIIRQERAERKLAPTWAF